MTPEEKFIITTAALARRSGKEWSDFVQAFADFKEIKVQELVNAPPDQLGAAQGTARAYYSLQKRFGGIIAEADTLEAKLSKTRKD